MNKSSKFHRLMQILAMFLCVAMVAGTLGTANAVKAASAPANYSTNRRIVISETDKLSDVVWKDDGSEFNVKFAVSFSVNDEGHRNTTVGVKTTWLESADGGKTYTETKTTDGTNGSIRDVSLDGRGKSEKLSNSLSVVSDKGLAESKAGMLYKVKIEVYTINSGWWSSSYSSTPFIAAETNPAAKLIYSSYVTFKNGDEKVVKEVPYGEKVEIAEPQAPAGQIFDGWYTEKEGGEKVDLATLGITEPQTLYARFVNPPVTTHSVTFSHKINGRIRHNIADYSVDVVDGEKVARPEKDPTCSESGHVFVNWYTDDSYTELFDFSKPITEDTTVVGRWSYRVQFTVDGQQAFDQALNPVQVNYGDTVLSVVPDINNITAGNGEYKITGWKIRNGYGYGTTNIDINTYKISSNITLIANVEKVKKYDVTYYSGTEKVFTDSVVAGKTYSIPEAYKTLTSADSHKTFLGWYTDERCTKLYTDAEINANLKLYAGWKTEYTVKFDANGKTFATAISGQTVESGTHITLPTNVTETTGKYEFIGWLVNGSSVSGTYQVNGDVEFVANWKDKTVYHTVTFVAREGNDETRIRHGFNDVTIQVEHGKLIDPSQIPGNPTCTVRSHVFEGWYTSIDLSTPFDFETMTITENTRIYSGWFIMNSDSLDASKAKKNYTEGDTLDLTNVKIVRKFNRVNGNTTVKTEEIPVTAEMVTNFNTITKTVGNNKKVEVKYDGKTYSYTINVARKIIDGSITLTDTKITKIYGAAPFAIGYKDATGDVTFESNNSKVAIVNEEGKIEIVGVGDATITVKVAANGSYTATEATVDLTVNPKQVSVTWTDTDLIYNGKEQAPKASLNGVVTGDEVNVTVSGAKKNVDSNYVATVSIDNTNYVLKEDESECTFSIAQKTVSLVWGSTELVYNGSAQAPAVRIADGELCENDTCEVTVTGKHTEVDDDYTAYASLSNENYALSADDSERDYVIAPKAIKLVWGEKTAFVYDGTEKAPAVSIAEGELCGDDVCEVTVTGNVNAGEYTAEAVLSNKNYVVAEGFAKKDYTIARKAVSFTLDIDKLICGTEVKSEFATEAPVAETRVRRVARPVIVPTPGITFIQDWENAKLTSDEELAAVFGILNGKNLSSIDSIFQGTIKGDEKYQAMFAVMLGNNYTVDADGVVVTYAGKTLKITVANPENPEAAASAENILAVTDSAEIGFAYLYLTLTAEHVPGEPEKDEDSVVAPTFEKEGSYNMVVKCTKCGEVLSRQPFSIAKLIPEVESITFSGFDKVKKAYLVGDELDVTGLQYTVKMTDGTSETKDVTKDMVTGFSSAVENNALVLSLTYGGEAASYTVSVAEPAGEYVVEGDTKFNGKDNMKLHIIHTNAKRNAGLFAQFGGLDMDGKVVAKANYDATNGSIKLDIHSDYLKTLSEGEHNLTVEIGEDKVDVKITITKVQEEATEPTQPAQQAATSDDAPSTGDTGSLVLWYVIALIALLSAAALAVARQKSRREEF